MMGLTPRQRDLLAYLSSHQSPSLREMGRALGYAESNLTAGVHRLLTELEARGYIRRLYGRARAIEVLRPLPIMVRGEPYRFIPKSRAA